MIYNQTMLAMWILRTSTSGIGQEHEVRALLGGDGIHPSTDQDLLYMGIVPSHWFLPASVMFVSGSLIIR